MMLLHQRYLAKLSAMREASANDVLPQQKSSLSPTVSVKLKFFAGVVFSP